MVIHQRIERCHPKELGYNQPGTPVPHVNHKRMMEESNFLHLSVGLSLASSHVTVPSIILKKCPVRDSNSQPSDPKSDAATN